MPLNFEIYLWSLGLCVFIFLVDDLLIDIISLVKKLGPQALAPSILFDPNEQRKLAIMVANWEEDDVLDAMINGNMERITQDEVHFFLGVYPNDTATYNIVKKLDRKYERVDMVINHLNGPTYKGQMLNEIIYSIFDKERELGYEFDGFIMHDSEDMLDPRLPYLYSLGLRQADFVQTPVLSMPLGIMEFTGGTYMDEFAEIHTKDLLVRQHLGAAVPSAGVGDLSLSSAFTDFSCSSRRRSFSSRLFN